jgi:hypothetical protein
MTTIPYNDLKFMMDLPEMNIPLNSAQVSLVKKDQLENCDNETDHDYESFVGMSPLKISEILSEGYQECIPVALQNVLVSSYPNKYTHEIL